MGDQQSSDNVMDFTETMQPQQQQQQFKRSPLSGKKVHLYIIYQLEILYYR